MLLDIVNLIEGGIAIVFKLSDVNFILAAVFVDHSLLVNFDNYSHAINCGLKNMGSFSGTQILPNLDMGGQL